MEILSAKEALAKTKEAILKRIEGHIQQAIDKGLTYVEITPDNQFISAENIQILKDAGYKVIDTQTMLGKEVKIYWE